MKRHNVRCPFAVVLLVTALGVRAGAQMPADEHQKHHPSQQTSPGGVTGSTASQMGSMPMPAGPPRGGAAAPGMGGGMGQMMQGMGQPPPKELYPSLMNLPDLPLEKRAEVEQQAHARMTTGTAFMAEAIRKLSATAKRDDYAAMQDAAAQLRQGLAQFESGLAAHRTLAEGKAPRNVALQWFRREMNLSTAVAGETPHGLFGLSWFHYFTMLLLLAFAVTMVWIQFHRMRRAEALLTSLAGKQPVSAVPPVAMPHRAATVSSAAATAPAVSTVAEPAAVQTTLPAGRWSGHLRVAKIFQETPDVRTFHMMHPAGSELPFTYEPGQFLTVAVTIDGKETRRSYSIASSPVDRSSCEITVKRAPHGMVSNFLHDRVRAGDLIAVSGPFGRFSFRGTEAPSIVLLAGGVGITPLISAIRYLTDQNWQGEIFLFYAAATLEDLIFREELEYLIRRHPNLHVTFVLSKETSPSWTGSRGRISRELLLDRVPDLDSRRVHICGPLPMMDAMKAILADIGVPAEQVKTETFLGAEPKPSAPGAVPAAPEARLGAAVCMFRRSGKTAALTPDRTVLEASEEVGVNIDYSCRQGYCGVCKVKLTSGHVTMASEEALTLDDKAAGMILACQAKSNVNLEVEA